MSLSHFSYLKIACQQNISFFKHLWRQSFIESGKKLLNRKENFSHFTNNVFYRSIGHAFSVTLVNLKIDIMKTIINYFSKAAIVFTSFFISLVTFAQEKTEVDINVNKKDSTWYAQPWVWIVGAAVFIIIIVALLRGGGRAKE